MNRMFALTIAATVLAGCGSGSVGNSTSSFDAGFRDSFKPKFVASCQAGAQKSSGTTKDFSAICGCIADKLLATKSVSELMAGPSEEENRRLAAECMQEHPLQ